MERKNEWMVEEDIKWMNWWRIDGRNELVEVWIWKTEWFGDRYEEWIGG